jgi:hypothetical protein
LPLTAPLHDRQNPLFHEQVYPFFQDNPNRPMPLLTGCEQGCPMRSSSDAVGAVSKCRILSPPGRFQLDIVELSFGARLGAKSSPTAFSRTAVSYCCVFRKRFLCTIWAPSPLTPTVLLPCQRWCTREVRIATWPEHVLFCARSGRQLKSTPTAFFRGSKFVVIATLSEHDNVEFVDTISVPSPLPRS